MVGFKGGRCGGVDGLALWSQLTFSEIATSDMLIDLDKFWSARRAPYKPAFMSSWLTIRHTCLPCLPSERILVIYLLLGVW